MITSKVAGKETDFFFALHLTDTVNFLMTEPVIQYRKATSADFEGILRLQHQYLITSLQEEDLSQGFLSMKFTREQLHKVNGELGIFIALHDKEVIGYLMAESIEFAIGSPLIAHLLKRLNKILSDDVPCCMFVYGPVCIDKHFRGKGVLDGMFNLMLQTLKGQYEVGIAFVSALNPRSFKAHHDKLGMKLVDEFEFNEQQFKTLMFRLEEITGERVSDGL